MYDNLIYLSENHLISFNTIIIPDHLHISKRAQYRVVCSNIQICYENNFIDVKISDFKINLNLSSTIYNNLSKMHELLPGKLFSICLFLTLYNNSIVGAYIYSFPFTMQLISLNETILNPIERLFCLETAFYFLFFYFNMKINYSEPLDTSEKNRNEISIHILLLIF